MSRANSKGIVRDVDSVNGHPQPCPCRLCEILVSYRKPETRQCERYNRNHGGIAKLICEVCRQGPCEHDAYKDVRDVPNRLYGAEINHEGDAI